MQCMIQLGKLANPIDGKTEADLDGAQATIDILDMLKEKTKNNLPEEERKTLDQIIADLKLNFVDEKNKASSNTEINEDGKEAEHPAEEQKSED